MLDKAEAPTAIKIFKINQNVKRKQEQNKKITGERQKVFKRLTISHQETSIRDIDLKQINNIVWGKAM